MISTGGTIEASIDALLAAGATRSCGHAWAFRSGCAPQTKSSRRAERVRNRQHTTARVPEGVAAAARDFRRTAPLRSHTANCRRRLTW
jgi:hypothetical protein